VATDFLQRARKELKLNIAGLREIILTVSERVNRKVQVLKLQWQASQISDAIDAVYERLGERLDAVVAGMERRVPDRYQVEHAAGALATAVGQLNGLRRDLVKVDGLVRELEADVLRDDLLRLQQDLGSRGLALERTILSARSPAIGRALAELSLPAELRLIAILRGPAVLEQSVHAPLREGDVILWLGRSADLKAGQQLLQPPPL